MIFWQHIKGYNETADSTSSNGVSGLYTFLKFQSPITNKTDYLISDYVPTLVINTTNTPTGGTDFGHIITQKAQDQSISNSFKFGNNLEVAGTTALKSTLEVDEKTILKSTLDTSGNITVTTDSKPTLSLKTATATGISLSYTTNKIEAFFNNNATSISTLSNDGSVTFNNKCEAQYFNATSDRRAKTNIKPLNLKALDVIQNTPLYSFTYKELNTPSIGIIAQDVQNININGFKLVDNEEASGKDMDYMSIHESKLIYILWKAVQEQQAEIEELKKLLNK